jgi:hypothetical protein
MCIGNELDSLFTFYTSIDNSGSDAPLAQPADPIDWLRCLRVIDLLGATISFNVAGGSIVVDGPSLHLAQISISGLHNDLTGGALVGIGELTAQYDGSGCSFHCVMGDS